MPTTSLIAIPDERIVRQIHVIRGKKVMLDRDLAELYGVPTRRLNEQVKRNIKRFPDDFMFQLTTEEAEVLRSQIAISNRGRGGRRYLPYVFTEQGVAMLSSVLKSEQAIQINILIIKAFVRMRELLETNQVLRERLAVMEQQLGAHSKEIRTIYSLLQRLLTEPEPSKEPIGFRGPESKDQPRNNKYLKHRQSFKKTSGTSLGCRCMYSCLPRSGMPSTQTPSVSKAEILNSAIANDDVVKYLDTE
jgi:hypothetical protein